MISNHHQYVNDKREQLRSYRHLPLSSVTPSPLRPLSSFRLKVLLYWINSQPPLHSTSLLPPFSSYSLLETGVVTFLQINQQINYQAPGQTSSEKKLFSYCETQPPASIGWVTLSSVIGRLVVCPASPFISTVWCFRAYKPYIFCEDMILATGQCHHIFCCWVEPSLLLSSLVLF